MLHVSRYLKNAISMTIPFIHSIKYANFIVLLSQIDLTNTIHALNTIEKQNKSKKLYSSRKYAESINLYFIITNDNI